MQDFVNTLTAEFVKHADAANAAGQKAYMKNHFEFYGIKTPERRAIQKPFLTEAYLPSKKEMENIVRTLWARPEREYQYFSQELVEKYTARFDKKDIELLEFMITHKSWWDTVDFIATKLVGAYFRQYPQQKAIFIEKWIASQNIWLQRTAILFQLNYKSQLDKELLASIINDLLGSKEFFINKAIGWILRQYSKTNPGWVVDLTNTTPLERLSHSEALRIISKKL